MSKRKRLSTVVSRTSDRVDEERLDTSQGEYMYGDAAETDLNGGAVSKDSPYPGTSATIGKTFLRGVDNRTWRAREMKTAYENIISDLGGESNVSFGQAEIARRVAAMHVIGLEMETALAVEDESRWDFDKYIIISRTQAQLMKVLGLKRQARDLNGPEDLDAYLRRQSRWTNKHGEK